MQRITILGATGSIGASTLDVLARHPERYRVHALSAHSRVEELAQACRVHRPQRAVVGTAEAAARLSALLADLPADLRISVEHGEQALCDIASSPDTDTVMAAIVGAAGLAPTLAAARAGKKVLLANKEALVMSGQLFMDAVKEHKATLLPIDSEHNAIFQSLPQHYARVPGAAGVARILLTASGGPFLNRAVETLGDVTPDEACKHPNWVMGRKISVDSATMMNKALEVIEARWLFDLAPEQIEVVIHPQSIIHSMVVCRDRSVLAQLGTPDMRVPIAYGLAWPERIESGAEALDFTRLAGLTFEPADAERFPGLQLAWEALRGPNGSTAVLNAANEVAVAAFLAGTIRFDQIHSCNAHTIEHTPLGAGPADSLLGLLALDAEARAIAQQRVRSLA